MLGVRSAPTTIICVTVEGKVERAYAGSRNMKVDRIGALHNSYLCTRCLRVRHRAADARVRPIFLRLR